MQQEPFEHLLNPKKGNTQPFRTNHPTTIALGTDQFFISSHASSEFLIRTSFIVDEKTVDFGQHGSIPRNSKFRPRTKCPVQAVDKLTAMNKTYSREPRNWGSQGIQTEDRE
jgi:hypothetical protein